MQGIRSSSFIGWTSRKDTRKPGTDLPRGAVHRDERVADNSGLTRSSPRRDRQREVDEQEAGAKKAGKTLLPTELVVFGNPKIGTPLMLCGRSIAIDLPQKALIWQDDAGDTWISYNDPQYLKQRHGTEGCDAVFQKVAGALAKFTSKAAAAE